VITRWQRDSVQYILTLNKQTAFYVQFEEIVLSVCRARVRWEICMYLVAVDIGIAYSM